MFQFETPEQLLIRQSIAALAQREFPNYAVEAFYNSVPRELFLSLAHAGVGGLGIDPLYGGLGASQITSIIVMEELAAVDLGPAIFVSVHNMVAGLISRHGREQQKKEILPRMGTGELLGAFALTEPHAGSDAAALSTSAREDGEFYILNGEKCYITSAGWADLFVVFARTTPGKDSSGISAFIVDARSPGLGVSKPERKMGCELSPIASLAFRDVLVPKANLLGHEGDGFKIALSGLAGGRINIAACANGLMRTAINRAAAHLREREQFGHPLIEFQGLQFMLADMRMKLEAAQLLTWQAARTLELEPDNLENRSYPSIAKCFATDAAMSVTTDAVQLLGGAGYLKDYGVEKLMREAKMLQIVEGSNQLQKVLIAKTYRSNL